MTLSSAEPRRLPSQPMRCSFCQSEPAIRDRGARLFQAAGARQWRRGRIVWTRCQRNRHDPRPLRPSRVPPHRARAGPARLGRPARRGRSDRERGVHRHPLRGVDPGAHRDGLRVPGAALVVDPGHARDRGGRGIRSTRSTSPGRGGWARSTSPSWSSCSPGSSSRCRTRPRTREGDAGATDPAAPPRPLHPFVWIGAAAVARRRSSPGRSAAGTPSSSQSTKLPQVRAGRAASTGHQYSVEVDSARG